MVAECIAECCQLVGTATDPEYRAAWLKGYTGIERPGVDSIESEPIYELHGDGDGTATETATATATASGSLPAARRW